MMSKVDVIIAGGGVVGCTAALAISRLGMNVALVDAAPAAHESEEPRPSYGVALSAGSASYLEQLGVWSSLLPLVAPIGSVHVSEKGSWPKVRMSASELGVEALGYVADARLLSAYFAQCLAGCPEVQRFHGRLKGLELRNDSVDVLLSAGESGGELHQSARLLIASDGTDSTVREQLGIAVSRKDYHQKALVALMGCEHSHGNRAYERFTGKGAIAMLPHRESRQGWLVWTLPDAEADQLLAGGKDVLIGRVSEEFGSWLGKLWFDSEPAAVPLARVMSQQGSAQRSVIIGNAAHQLHPIAGQGLNLGLRDVQLLERVLRTASVHQSDPGAKVLLDGYESDRACDQKVMALFTDKTVEAYSRTWGIGNSLRRAGLSMLGNFPMARRRLAWMAMGLSDFQLGR